jgi:hypothetical protein
METNQSTKFIGLDIHKNSISLAIASNGEDGEVRLYGTISNCGGLRIEPVVLPKVIRIKGPLGCLPATAEKT